MSQEHVRIRPTPISMPGATGQRPLAPAHPRACTKSARQMWLVFLSLLVIAGVYLMVKGRGNNFLADDWNWVQYRHSGLRWIVASYNQHLLAVPIALYQMLFTTVGLAHYWVFRLFLTLAHLACVTAVFAFARRRIGWAAVAVTLPLLFLGSGWEYVLDPVNFGFVASIGLGVCALSALERGNRRGDALACALLVLGLACSELAVVFAVGIVVELLWRDQRLDRIWIAAVPLVLYAAWWLGYHQPSMARQNLTAVPAYGADLAASAVGGLLGLSLDWGRALLVAGDSGPRPPAHPSWRVDLTNGGAAGRDRSLLAARGPRAGSTRSAVIDAVHLHRSDLDALDPGRSRSRLACEPTSALGGRRRGAVRPRGQHPLAHRWREQSAQRIGHRLR